MAKRSRKESQQPPEDTAPIQIPSTAELIRLYGEQQKAVQINALLKKYINQISFPISNEVDFIDAGLDVSHAFLYFMELIELLEKHNMKQIIDNGYWRDVNEIVKILKVFGFGGKFFDDIEKKIALDREESEKLILLKLDIRTSEMRIRIYNRLASVHRDQAESLNHKINLLKEQFKEELSDTSSESISLPFS